MPHILLSGALRTGGPTIQAWRERCRTWQAEVPETDAPTAWKVSFRALRKEETAASSCHQDDKEDIETCRVVARCLSSSWSLPDIDPEEPRSGCKRDGPFKRMLNSNMAYSIVGEERKSGEHRDFQSQADLHFADSRVVKNGSEVPPHILGLAMAVNQRVDPSSTSSLRFLKAVCSQLDVQLFNASLDSFQPQALLHPFTFNACCMMNMLRTELLPEQCSKPFDDMINAVASINKLSDAVEAIPADALKAKFGKEQSQAAAALLKKREELHQLVLEVPPSRRHTAKTPRSETLTQMDTPEVYEMKKAMEMLEPASKVPAVTSLPFENPYSMLLKLSLAEIVQGQKPELLEALMCISKALAIGPACQELWWSAGQVCLQLFLLQDDADSLVEPWSQKLQVLAGSSDMKWSPCWRFLYGQARMLNQLWQCRLTWDLNSGLQKTLKAGHRQIPGELSHLALQWFERQLEMLVLLRCRRRYFARNNESKLVSHLNRCKRTAQTLLWFLIKCTDMSGEFHYTADVMATVKDWERPVFAETWCKLANGGSQPLLCFRGMDGRDRVPATYLWYVPYILGRIEWKLSKLCPASPERLQRKSIICLLMDACHVELAVRASLTERRRDEIMETEPSFRLHAVRLAILFGSPDGYESAGTICFDTNCLELSRQNVIVDALKGMQAVVQENKCHMGKYLSCEARALLDSGELNRAADCVIKIVDEAMRARKFRVPSFGACLNPHVMLCQRARKAERQQWAAMQTCLDVQQALLQAILGVKAFAALQEKPDDLRGFESCSGVHPGHRTKVVNALKSLDQNRPESWQALFQVKHALLRMVFACIDTESNTSFELAQTVYLLRAIRRSFNALVKANSPGGRSNAPSRPYLDWRLFSLLRHLCLRCSGMRRFLDDPKLCQEVELLQASLKAAAWRLFCFGLGTGEPARSSTSDEDFFESLQGQMPQTKELKDLIGVAIDGGELDA
ncbi:yos-9 [Symbiodinium sp. CCMP2456]|nr:yos-9 [Symbiodinium sp. CCMP2456]